MANSESAPEGVPPQQPEDLSRISPKEQPAAATPADDLDLAAILSGAKERLDRIEGTLENSPTTPDTAPVPAPAGPRPRGVITDNVEPPVETPDENLPAPAQPPRRARQPRGAGGATPPPTTAPAAPQPQRTPPTPIAPATPPAAAAPVPWATPLETPPATPAEAAPEGIEQETLLKGAAFLEEFLTGGKTEGEEDLFKELKEVGCWSDIPATKAARENLLVAASRAAEAKRTMLELEKTSLAEKLAPTGTRKGAVVGGLNENEAQKAKLSFEKYLDEMKLAMVTHYREDNHARFPNLSEEDINKQVPHYIANVIYRAGSHFYTALEAERSELIARTPAERGLLSHYGNFNAWRNKLEPWQRVLVGASIGAGIGLVTAGSMAALGILSVPLLAPVAATKLVRTFSSGMISASILAGTEAFFGEKLDARGKKKREAAQSVLAKEKQAFDDPKIKAYEEKLRAEIEANREFFADRVTALKVMEKVDADALALSEERKAFFGPDFARREQEAALIGTRWRKRLEIGTTLVVGGGMALSAVDWERIPGWINGVKSSAIDYVSRARFAGGGLGAGVLDSAHDVADGIGDATRNGINAMGSAIHNVIDGSLPSMGGARGGGGILDRVHDAVLGRCPDITPSMELPDPFPICDPTEANVLTINEGSSVWRTAHQLVGETIQGPDGPVKVTKAMIANALNDSTVDMVTKTGKAIKVPLLEVGLVHAGDQIALVNENGKWVVWVGDYAKDHYNVGNNALFKQIHEANNLPVANWMREGTTPPAKLIANKGNLLSRICDVVVARGGTGTPSIAGTAAEAGISAPVGEITGTSLTPKAWAEILPEPEPVPGMSKLPETLYTPDGITEITNGFAESSLYDQERAIASLNTQITGLEQLMTTPAVGSNTSAQLAQYHNELSTLKHALVANPEHLSNVVELGGALAAHDVSLDFYNSIENMGMKDFMKLSENPASLKKSGALLGNVFRIYADEATRLHDAITALGTPGRAEMRMTVGNFMKHYASELVVREAA